MYGQMTRQCELRKGEDVNALVLDWMYRKGKGLRNEAVIMRD